MTDLLEPNPFAKSIFASDGDPVARNTFTSVGAALSAWEHCEASFGALYSAFVKPTGGNHIVMRAYGTILAAGTRREMIAEAAEAYFGIFPSPGLAARVKKLLNLYKDAAARRNEIAHGMVMSGALPIDLRKVEYFLVPGLFASNKRDLASQWTKYRLGTKEIDHYRACFDELGSRAGALMQDVRVFYDALPETLRLQFP